MATFENLRFCKVTEFDYFEQERKATDSLQTGELYVAMFALRQFVSDFGAVALPLKIVEVEEKQVSYKSFKSDSKLADEVLKFILCQRNYINGDTTVILPQRVGIKNGYIRDHNEGLDGTPPEIGTEVELRESVEALIAA